MRKIVALLPMKGNSERVPNKNLKDFCGKPLYHCVFNELLKSKYISKVVVNTDSSFIAADIIENFSKEDYIIIDRHKGIQGDFVSMNTIIEHDINIIDSDYYIQTHSTNPLLTHQSIDLAIEEMLKNENKFDSIFSVTRHQTRLYDKNIKPLNHNPEELLRTQDLEPIYEENSNFYIFSKSSFIESGNKRIGKNPAMFQIDKIDAVDIDEPQDFIIAENLFKLLRTI